MGKHTVHFVDTGESLACSDTDNLLRAMEKLGRRGIPVGCRNGGCGVCKVLVLDGQCDRRVMSRAHVGRDEEAQGYALACRITPTSDLYVKVIGKMGRAFATPQTTTKPSIRPTTGPTTGE